MQFFQVFQLKLFSKITIYHKKITMSKNVNVFQILLYIEETSIYNSVHKVLEAFYTFIVKTNCQFIKKNVFLKAFYLEAMLFSIPLYQWNIYIGILCFGRPSVECRIFDIRSTSVICRIFEIGAECSLQFLIRHYTIYIHLVIVF